MPAVPIPSAALLGLALAVAPATAPAAAPAAPVPPAPRVVTATAETPAVFDDEAGGDADADDPAVWVHPTDPAASLVLGTAKNGGLRVYDLHGREVQSIATPPAPAEGSEAGRFNNVDLVHGFRLGGRTADLAVVTDRGRDQLRAYRIDPAAAAAGRAPLVDVTAPDAPLLFSADQAEVDEQATGYGLATWTADGRAHAAVSRRHTSRLGLFELREEGGRVTYAAEDVLDLPTSFRLPGGGRWTPCGDPGEGPQVEGMAVDVENGVLYAAQEDVGLWRLRLDTADGEFRRGRGARGLVERVAEYGVPATYDPATEECAPGADPGLGGRISADVEGVTIYRTGARSGRVVVSSQGDSTFYAYDRRTGAPAGRFAVGDGRVDGVQHSDGAAAVSTPLPGYPGGLLVVHDGEDTPAVAGPDGEPRPATGFKFVDWRCLDLT